MRGNTFTKNVARPADERGIECRVDNKRGKGSHVSLYYGTRKTIVRNPKDELKTGTFHAMLGQLGIGSDEIQEQHMRAFTCPFQFTRAKEGDYVVTCLDVPEAIAQGETLDDAKAEAADAFDEALQGRIEDDEDVPVASRARKGEHLVSPPVGTALKLAAYLALRDAKINRSELARRLDLDEGRFAECWIRSM